MVKIAEHLSVHLLVPLAFSAGPPRHVGVDTADLDVSDLASTAGSASNNENDVF